MSSGEKNERGTPGTAKEWDMNKNIEEGLALEKVGEFSEKFAWWRCPKGHTYKMRIDRRVYKGDCCPECAAKYVKDIPELAREFDVEENEISLDELLVGSSRKVHWKCAKAGHKWVDSAASRQRNKERVSSGKYTCPFCSGARVIIGENDLFTLHSELKEEWDYEENDKLKIKPEECKENSNKKVYWHCVNGHKYKRDIYTKVQMCKECPICQEEKRKEKGKLKEKNQEIVSNRHFSPRKREDALKKRKYEKRVFGVSPQDADVKKEKTLLKEKYPALAERWNEEKNKENINMVASEGDSQYYWWKCEKGYEWISTLGDMKRKVTKSKCPYCEGLKSRSSV